MKKFKSLLSFLALVFFTCFGQLCDFPQSRSELTDINTKEEAFELMKSKFKNGIM